MGEYHGAFRLPVFDKDLLMNAQEILDREYLVVRAKILEIAASLDRIDRADGDVNESDAMHQVRKGMEIVLSDSSNRAEQVQMLFSRPYEKNWQEKFEVAPRF